MKRYLLFLLLPLLLLLFLTPTASHAQAKSYYWDRLDVDVVVEPDGDLRVTEYQTLTFSGPFTFGYRAIPTGSAGNNDGISDVSIREGDISYAENNFSGAYNFTVTSEGDEQVIRWYFPETTGRHSYTLSYTVEDAIRTEESGDQVFWNALPSDLGARVANSSITIQLPEGISAATTTALWGGVESDNIVTEVSENGQRITYRLAQPRPSGIPVEVGVRFPSGQLDLSTPGWQRAEQIADMIGLVLLVISLLIVVGGPLLVLLLWYLFGRDPDVGPVPDYVTAPPDETPPAVVGTLVDEKADMQDIMSTLVDLARRGYLRMAETSKSADYSFQRTDQALADLRPFEKEMIQGIFGSSKKERSLDSLQYKFASRLPKIRTHLYQELEEKGFVRRSPESVRNQYGCLAFAIGGVAFLGFFALPALLPEGVPTLICPAISLALTAVLMLVISRFMPAKTQKGAEATAYWLAFKRYLQDIEQHTDLEAASDIFEKYLPYAIAFGLERSWIRKFSSVPGTPIPPWYLPYPVYGGYGRSGYPTSGSGGRSPGEGGGMPSLEGMSGGLTGGLEGMSRGLTRMLTNTQTVLQSTPPSSSSGGSGGGGFSGGFSGGSSGGGSGGFG